MRNIIAKVASIIKSIRILYSNDCIFEGWILYRSLLDRLGHIYQLNEQNSYDEFCDWSYQELYRYDVEVIKLHKSKNDDSYSSFEPTKEMEKKYKEICKKNISWKREKVKDIFKK